MLTVETLQQDDLIKGLAPDVIARIAQMSKNDEESTLGAKIGELHGRYDSDVLTASGIAKKQGEKSYDYTKRVIGVLKADAEKSGQLRQEISTANAKIAELQQTIEKGGDAALQAKIADYKSQISVLEKNLASQKANFEKETAALKDQLTTTRVDGMFKAAIAGFNFKDSISEGIKDMVLNSAKAEVLSKYTPEFDETGNMVFRGADKQIVRSATNGLQPSTFEELLMATSMKDIIDTGKHQTGGGTGNQGGAGNQGGSGFILDGVKTQLEANQKIEEHLLAAGYTRDSEEFAQQSLELYKENNVGNLPLR